MKQRRWEKRLESFKFGMNSSRFPRLADFRQLIRVYLLGVFLCACSNADAQSYTITPPPANTETATYPPTFTQAPTPLPETLPPSSTIQMVVSETPARTDLPTASATNTPPGAFSITVHNPYSWEAHIFVDNLYLMTIPADEWKSHGDIQPGTRTFHYCQSKVMLTCAPPVTINISSDTTWEMGQIPAAEPTAAVPTAIKISTPLPPPVYYSVQTWQIKVNNYFPWSIYIFLDDELFLSVPRRSYLTYSGIPEGKYTFRHCHDQDHKYCFLKKTFNITGNTEWSIIP